MNNFTWDINKIQQNRKEVVRLISKNNCDKEEIEHFKTCLSVYESLIDCCNGAALETEEIDFKYLRDGFNNFRYEYNKNIKKLFLDIIKSIKIDNNFEYTEELPKYNLSMEESIELNKMFFRMLDYKLYEKVCEILDPKKNLIYVRENDYSFGVCWLDGFKNLPYIVFGSNNTIETTAILNHELSHGVEFLLNPSIIDSQKEPLNEMVAIFNELVYCDFLIEEGFGVESMIQHKINMFISFTEDYDLTHEAVRLARVNKKNYKKSTKNLFELDFDIEGEIVSFVSFLAALQLYEQYLEDKDYAVYNLNKFIKCNRNVDFLDILDEIDINIFDSERCVGNHVNRLKKELYM